jgi:V8-like Glu-specific endopeptidase
MTMVADPDDSIGVRGTKEELQARAADLARQGALPVESVVEVAQSTEPADLLERIIGATSARRPANWASRAARAAATVCRIRVQQGSEYRVSGTGFLVSPELLLTTWHVVPDPAMARTAVAEFTVDSDGTGAAPRPVRYSLDPDTFFVADEKLDFTLVNLRTASDAPAPGDTVGWNRLSVGPGKILVGEPINLIDYPQGGDKQIQTGGSSRLVAVSGDVLQYLVESEPGSSGAPVFNDQWEVVAMHRAHATTRRRPADTGSQTDVWRAEGIRVSAILQHLAGLTLDDYRRALLAQLGPDSGLAPGDPNGRTGAGPAPGDWIAGLVGDNPLVARLIEDARQHPDAYPDADSVRRALAELVAADYARLDPGPARLLRRAALLGDDGADPWIAGRLAGTDRAGAVATLRELARAGLLVERSDGRLYFVHDAVREYAQERFEETETADEQDALRQEVRRWRSGRDHRAEPQLSRDFWTTADELDYGPYTQAIASFIQHRQTLPPLTIGVKAPWGAGKTSLMRMVQKRLDPGVGEDPLGPGAAGPRQPRQIRLTDDSRARVRQGPGGRSRSGPLGRAYRAVVRRAEPAGPAADARVSVAEALGLAGAGADLPPAGVRAELVDKVPHLAPEDWRATVWFNPWMYQSGEQVWAGLTHEIITQITGRLPVGDRERFWLRLNLARLDQEALRRRTYRAVVLRVLPFIAVAAAATLIAVAALLLVPLVNADWLRPVAAWVAALGTGAGAVGAAARGIGFLFQAAAGPFGSLVRGPDIAGRARTALAAELEASYDEVLPDPGYGSKVGFLYLVQTDIRRVLDLVASERRPLVVFVDDLDRCSPGTVAQVMEAVNLFLAGEFPNCIFVVAMEPAVVAAHIEAAYPELVAVQQPRDQSDGSTLGWRFLEKIVQLPLSLPGTRDHDHLTGYARGLLGLGRDGVPAEAGSIAGPGPTSAGPPPPAPQPTTQTSGLAPAQASTGGVPAGPAGPARTPDPALVRQLASVIRTRRPTVRGLPELALQVQGELVAAAGVREPLPETRAAVEAVFKDIYRDEDAADALAAALPGLGGTTPREIKRYLNLFRFYTFIVELQRFEGAEPPSSEQVAKLAALAIRWPQLVSAIGGVGTDGEHPLAGLEEASRTSADWTEALARYCGVTPAASEAAPAWYADLRTFLADGPRVGALAGRLL